MFVCVCVCVCVSVFTYERKCMFMCSHPPPLSSSGVGLFRVNKAGHVVKFEDVDSFHVFRLLNPPEGGQQIH